MGEAKRRKAEICALQDSEQAWREGLSHEEREILTLAERVAEKIVLGRHFTEACYHLAFFMSQFLEGKGINVTPIVGWVSDGTWEGLTSHAWIEYEGKKVDVSLLKTSAREEQPYGEMIVLDRVLKKGDVSYQYFQPGDPEIRIRNEKIRSMPMLRAVFEHKVEEHRKMEEIASSRAFASYLNGAPQGGRYEDLLRYIGPL
jgi:hypothetical protein